MRLNILTPSAVLSITPVLPIANACNVPVLVSLARSGYLLAILPSSDI